MSANTLGEKISQERKKQGVSLRKFAQKLGISASYLVDIEKDRRLANKALLQTIADMLDIPVSAFDEFSPDMPKQVKKWIEKNPLVSRILNFLGRAPSPEDALARVERSLVQSQRRKYPIAIYESELQAIGEESISWNTETGGDLFGIWGDIPVVYLASRAGPQSVREHTHFRLDVDYLINLSISLEKDWGLRYFGDWHSHHRLGLQQPSSGDQKRIAGVAAKNNFNEMAEFIVTFASKQDSGRAIEIHPYAYLDLPLKMLTDIVLIVLKGTSPVREALIAASSLPKQQLDTFSSFPTEKISVPEEPLGRIPGKEGVLATQISERLLSKTMSELAPIASGALELYYESFGFIVVVPVNKNENVAFALDKDWPHNLLQADWMDRKNGRSEEIPTDTADISLLNVDQLKHIFSKEKKLRSSPAK